MLRLCVLGFFVTTLLRFLFYSASYFYSLFSDASNLRLAFFKHVTDVLSVLLYVAFLFVLLKNTILPVAFPEYVTSFSLEGSYFWQFC